MGICTRFVLFAHPRTFPVCSCFVPGLFLGQGGLRVPGLFLPCSWPTLVHALFPLCSRFVPALFTVCSRITSQTPMFHVKHRPLSPVCSRFVPGLFPVCSRFVHGLFFSLALKLSPVCSRYVPVMFTVCSRFVHGLFTVCSRFVLLGSKVHLYRYVPAMFPVCSCYVPAMFMLCSCYVLASLRNPRMTLHGAETAHGNR